MKVDGTRFFGVSLVVNPRWRATNQRPSEQLHAYVLQPQEYKVDEFKRMLADLKFDTVGLRSVVELLTFCAHDQLRYTTEERIDDLIGNDRHRQRYDLVCRLVDSAKEEMKKFWDSNYSITKRIKLFPWFAASVTKRVYFTRTFHPTHIPIAGAINEFTGFAIPPWWFGVGNPTHAEVVQRPTPDILRDSFYSRSNFRAQLQRENLDEEERMEGVQWFLEHLEECLCGGDVKVAACILIWLARILQHPEKKTDLAVILQGPAGIGKTFL